MAITLVASVMMDSKNNKYIINNMKGIPQLPTDILWSRAYFHDKRLIMDYYTFSDWKLDAKNIIVYTPKQIDYVKDDKLISFCNYINWEALSSMEEEFVVCGGKGLFDAAILYANKIRLTVLNVYGNTSDPSNVYFPTIHDYGRWRVQNKASAECTPQYKSLLQQNLTLHSMSLLEFIKI